jgi:ubiquinone/menaquinone biosynthesis C-methylase UbiE
MRSEAVARLSDRRSRLVRRYDSGMYMPLAEEYYSGSDFWNFGYWEPGIRSQKEASENLMERLLALIPGKHGSILDVACGKGATTRHLLRYYEPSRVTGINISAKQIARCRENAPGARFLVMDAAALQFEPETFDAVICVEAVFHFSTREKFLHEAARVLKPGGYLVLSDIIGTRALEHTPGRHPANYVPDLEAYRRLYGAAGFDAVRIIDATKACWTDYVREALTFVRGKVREGAVHPAAYRLFARLYWQISVGVRHYLLVSARKGLHA